VSIDPDQSLSDLQRAATSSAVAGDSGCSTQTYHCPGESSPVSRAVHLGRLAAEWSGCRDCAWKNDIGDTDRFAATGRAEIEKRPGVRRTELGVRGTYLNAIDRFRAAQLASIFSTQLAQQITFVDVDGASEADDADVVRATSNVAVAIGYDGRRGAPDLFAGVHSAVRQNGCDVVDAGRCTAASLLHVIRTDPYIRGAILVTGAGAASGDVGMDVFTQDQQPVPVPWQKFGVINRARHIDRRGTPGASIDDALAQFRSGNQHQAHGATDVVPFEESELILPDLTDSGQQLFRSVRHSGGLTSVKSEDEYRLWLQRWWPNTSGVAVTAVVADAVVAERLQWLASERLLNIQLQTAPAALTSRDTAPHDVGRTTAVRFEVEEDDRFVRIATRNNKFHSADKVAAWINHATHTGNLHVTAHATADRSRILLADVASPNSGMQQELISDGLAVAGLVTSLLSNGKNRLPV
jgi:hypothetical protein